MLNGSNGRGAGPAPEMPGLREAKYARVPRQVQSVGAWELNWPVLRLIAEFIFLYASRVLAEARRRKSDRTVEERLEQAGWSPALLDLADVMPGRVPAGDPRTMTSAAQEKFLAAARGAADPDSPVDPRLELLADDARKALESRVAATIESIRREDGPQAALECLDVIRHQVRDRRRELDGKPEFNRQESSRLHDLVVEAADLAIPQGPLRRWMKRRWRQLPLSWLVTEARARRLRETHAQITELLERHAAAKTVAARRGVLHALDVPSGRSGLLDRLAAVACRDDGYFDAVSLALQPDLDSRGAGAGAIVLGEGLSSPLGAPTAPTPASLFFQACLKAGRSPAWLADQLWQRPTALFVSGRRLLPSEWSSQDVGDIVAALKARVDQELGFDQHGPSDPARPRSAREYLERIDLGHAAIRKLVRDQLEPLFRFSAPYAARPRVGGQPIVERFLYCHPSHRPWLEGALKTYGSVAPNPAGDAGRGSFDIDDRNTILLVQFVFGLAGQAQLSFRRGGFAVARLSAKQKSAGRKYVPLVEPWTIPEMRLLDERPDNDPADAEGLLKVLRLCGEVVPVVDGSDRLTLAVMEESQSWIFYSKHFHARSLLASRFAELLKTAAFHSIIARLFPERRDWPKLTSELARRNDPEAVAEALADEGMVERAGHGLYRLARFSQLQTQPRLLKRYEDSGLYSVENTELVGRTAEEFVKFLLGDDMFYSVVAHRALDAYARGECDAADLPPFLANLAKLLGRDL